MRIPETKKKHRNQVNESPLRMSVQRMRRVERVMKIQLTSLSEYETSMTSSGGLMCSFHGHSVTRKCSKRREKNHFIRMSTGLRHNRFFQRCSPLSTVYSLVHSTRVSELIQREDRLDQCFFFFFGDISALATFIMHFSISAYPM